MRAVRREIVILPLFAVRNDRRAVASNRSMVSQIASSQRGASLGSSLSPFATLSMRSTGLGILQIGSVGMVIGVGLAILTAFPKHNLPHRCEQ